MSVYVVFPLFAVLAILQSSLLARLDVSGLYPNVTLLTVIAWGLLRGPREGLWWGFVGGLCLDFVSSLPFGFHAFVLTWAGYLSGLGESRLFRSNVALPVFFVVSLSLGYALTQMLALQWRGAHFAWLDVTLTIVLPTLALNLLTGPLVFFPLRWLNRRTGREQLGW
jgi:rod shape-determining protein MreD